MPPLTSFRFAFALLLFFAVFDSTLLAQRTPAGYSIEFTEETPCEKITEWRFFKDGTCLYRKKEVSYTFRVGKWSRKNATTISVKFHTAYYDQPVGEPLKTDDASPCGIYSYATYSLVKKAIDETEDFAWKGIGSYEGTNGYVDKHGIAKGNVQDILKTKFEGKYTQASTRLLTQGELSAMSAEDLALMHNEILARYGYIFPTKELQDYFGEYVDYTPRYTDVSAALSEIEKKNIELIKQAEAGKR